ncbi:P-loop NTPase family protein [Neoroseomonas soli]|uniref:Organic solvent ABC transporter ATP-binding protein n=1 Tax=Neoroseomonas soli TaxID=1081025 RepID=A0A9X9WTU0_9PROT|nr:organic solvent ABC transporter ATP-binding protein [Neoroseomonas soli]MBR0670569.1 organic solvent ABC transporter ATP-binding protein [Neoroseomonas soli]
MSGTSGRPPVLAMEAARDLGMTEDGIVLDLRLEAGELALVLAPEPSRAARCADLASGLDLAAEGQVTFLGYDWSRQPDDIADALRGRIGRVFHNGGWIPYLSLAENILLPLLHHTRTPEPELRDRAAALAHAFGLPGLPLERPTSAPVADLARAACVRAFLGEPMLVLLEDPLQQGRVPDLAAPLRDAVAAARARGAACLWMTSNAMFWGDSSPPSSQRLVLSDRGFRRGRARP